MTKGRNNKGRHAGSGTVSGPRREAFKRKGMARENSEMAKNDVQVDWEQVVASNKKARRLAAEEIQEMLKPKPQKDKEVKAKAEGKETGPASVTLKPKIKVTLLPRDKEKEEPASFDKKDAGNVKEEPASFDKKDAGNVEKEPEPVKEEPASIDKKDSGNVEEVKEKSASFDKKDAGNVEKEPAKEESASFDKKDAVAQKDPADEKKPTQDQRAVLKPPLKEFGPSEAQKDKEKQGKGNKRHVARELSWQRKVARDRSPSEDSHFSQSSSSSSYSTPTQTERMRLPQWIAVDWHNTLEFRGVVDKTSLEMLRDANVKVWVLSFAGQWRAVEVSRECAQLRREGLIEAWTCCRERCGQDGKLHWLNHHQVKHLFDDSYEILDECEDGGIKVFPIGPNSRRPQRFHSFRHAVRVFLNK